MNIVDLKPKTPEWHSWRAKGIGASESAIVLGLSPYKTPWQLWSEKCGHSLPEDLSLNPHVRRGISLEPKARAYIENAEQELLFPLCAESTDYPFLKASFDGINSKGEPVELKCPSLSVYDEVKIKGEKSLTYQLYYIQVQHQLLVANAQRGWLIFYSEDEQQKVEVITFEIKRDESIMTELISKAKEFWDKVQTGLPPDKCPKRDSYTPEGEALNQWNALAHRYQLLDKSANTISNELNKIKEEMSRLQNEFLALMNGFSHADCSGIKVTKYWAQGQVNYPQLINDLGIHCQPEQLNLYRKTGGEKVRFLVTHPVDLSLMQTKGETKEVINHPLEHLKSNKDIAPLTKSHELQTLKQAEAIKRPKRFKKLNSSATKIAQKALPELPVQVVEQVTVSALSHSLYF